MYGKILQQAMRGARNLGQAGKNYGRIAFDKGRDQGIRAFDKGIDVLRNNPEYAIGAGLAGVVGGSAAYGMQEMDESSKKRQYQAMRSLIKKETEGLGGLVYNKKKDKYIVTYGGTPNELMKNKHFHALKYIIDRTNSDLDIKMSTSIHALSKDRAEKHRKQIEQMLSTPEGAGELESYLNESEKTMQNPYSDDYSSRPDINPFTKDLPQGDTMGTGDFR